MANSPAMGQLRASEAEDQWVFWGLLALLVWAPLPLGSNRTWAVGILVVLVMMLLAGTVWVWRYNEGYPANGKHNT